MSEPIDLQELANKMTLGSLLSAVVAEHAAPRRLGSVVARPAASIHAAHQEGDAAERRGHFQPQQLRSCHSVIRVLAMKSLLSVFLVAALLASTGCALTAQGRKRRVRRAVTAVEMALESQPQAEAYRARLRQYRALNDEGAIPAVEARAVYDAYEMANEDGTISNDEIDVVMALVKVGDHAPGG